MNSLRLNPEVGAFGRHESFPLRYSWLPRGFAAAKEDPTIFDSDEATVVLGVGKNMVRSIRYWLLATRMLETVDLALQPTELGEQVFGKYGWDPFLEDEATIWLLHWLLSTHPAQSTVSFYFFNFFHKFSFTAQEAQTAFLDFLSSTMRARYAATTAKKDIAVLLRMYIKSRSVGGTPTEELLDSPLSSLGLINHFSESRSYQSALRPRPDLPVEVLAFAIGSLFDEMGLAQLPIEALLHTRDGWPAPGTIFRLTENGLLAKLEELVALNSSEWDLRETAGLHQLYRLSSSRPIDALAAYYTSHNELMGNAA
jgi:hypothetical protein